MIGYKKGILLLVWVISANSLQAFQKGPVNIEAELRNLLIEQQLIFSNLGEVSAQDAVSQNKTNRNEWTKSWMLNLSANQASYRNWSQGGVNTIAITASTLARFRYVGSSYSNTIRFNLQLGQTWLDGEDSRKTADLINVRNKVDYFLGTEQISAFAEVDFRTQFVKGFDEENLNVVSGFMAPGYLTESIGFSYQPSDDVSTQIGLGLRQTFVRVDSLASLYGLDENDDFRSEGGITIAVNVDKEFAETFKYSGELTTFTNLLFPLNRTDIIFRNELSGKLNSFLSTVIQFEIMFDDDVSDKLQMRQAISVGLSIKLL